MGNQFNHGLYHGLIPLFNIPFLNTAPPKMGDCLPISLVMAHPVVTLPATIKRRNLEAFLKISIHNGYPVVNDKQQLLGFLTRDFAIAAIEAAASADVSHHHGAVPPDMEMLDLTRFMDQSPLHVPEHCKVTRAYKMFQVQL